MTRHILLAIFAAITLGLGMPGRAEPNLPPGRTGGDGSNQAAGPSGQQPGQVGEIGGAGPHPGPQAQHHPGQAPRAPAADR